MRKLTWKQFENTCENLQNDFEDLCRLFFKNHFIHNKYANLIQTKNNEGIETEPYLVNGIKSGFQAKYFSNNISYDEISLFKKYYTFTAVIKY